MISSDKALWESAYAMDALATECGFTLPDGFVFYLPDHPEWN